MAYVVDTAQMDPGNAQEYLRLVETEAVPVMTEAGAGFVSCWETSSELGEEVSVKTIWSFADHVEWNVIRKNMVLDPRWYEYSREDRPAPDRGDAPVLLPGVVLPVA